MRCKVRATIADALMEPPILRGGGWMPVPKGPTTALLARRASGRLRPPNCPALQSLGNARRGDAPMGSPARGALGGGASDPSLPSALRCIRQPRTLIGGAPTHIPAPRDPSQAPTSP